MAMASRKYSDKMILVLQAGGSFMRAGSFSFYILSFLGVAEA